MLITFGGWPRNLAALCDFSSDIWLHASDCVRYIAIDAVERDGAVQRRTQQRADDVVDALRLPLVLAIMARDQNAVLLHRHIVLQI